MCDRVLRISKYIYLSEIALAIISFRGIFHSVSVDI